MAQTRMIGNRGPSPLVGKVQTMNKPKKRKKRVEQQMVVKRKRRKVSGIQQELPKALEMVVGAAAGGFAARIVLKTGMLAPSTAGGTDYRPYAATAIGIAGLLFVKNPMVKAASLGMAAVGSMGLIPDNDIPVIGSPFTANTIGDKPQVIRLQNNKRQQRMIAGNSYSVSPLIGNPYAGKPSFAGI